MTGYLHPKIWGEYIFDFLKILSTYQYRASCTPYAFFGVTLFHHNPQARVPKTDLNGNKLAQGGGWVNLQPLGTEGQNASLEITDANYKNKPYSRIQIAIPLGIGVRVRVSKNIDISGEFSFRYVFTDYLDDVSTTYIGEDKFVDMTANLLQDRSYEILDFNNRLGQEGRQRGWSKQKDQYIIAEIGLSFNISTYRCPSAN